MFRKKNRHTNPHVCLFAGILLSMLVACSQPSSGEPDSPGYEPRCYLGITIDLGNAGSTRGNNTTDPDFPKDGVGAENYIDLLKWDYRVYLFSEDGKYIAQLSQPKDNADFNIAFGEEGGLSHQYYVTFRLDKLIKDVYKKRQTLKVLMLANWGMDNYADPEKLIPGETTIEKLIASTDTKGEFDPAMPVSGNNPIPFYGVQTYREILFQGGINEIYDPPLNLLRAFAKIEVYDAEATTRPIRGVTLTRYNKNYCKAPADLVNPTSTPDAVNLMSPEETGTDIKLFKRGDDGHFVIYVPEYRNRDIDGNADVNAARLSLDYGDADTGYADKYMIDFKYYSGNEEGKYYDLIRNYWYKFEVSRKKNEINLEADVLPYLNVDLEPEFGIKKSDSGSGS